MRKAKIALVVAAALMMFAAHRLGLFHLFAEPARVKQALVDLGPWGYVAFLVAYTLLQPFGVPGTVFVMAAPLIWPWPVAFALSMAGTLSASVVGFSFARFVARDWVSTLIPARFRAYNDALAERAFVTVVTLRFVFWMPPMLHAFFGVSKVRFWTHFWGSAVGYFIPLLVVSYFGQKVFDWLRTLPLSTWVGAGVGTVVVIGLVLWIRRCARRPRPAPEG